MGEDGTFRRGGTPPLSGVRTLVCRPADTAGVGVRGHGHEWAFLPVGARVSQLATQYGPPRKAHGESIASVETVVQGTVRVLASMVPVQ